MKFFTSYFFCLLLSSYLLAQDKTARTSLQTERFIDKVELFAGPSLSFNHGNKFIENYDDGVLQNKRLLKSGFVAGVGVYHPLNRKIDINARIMWEQKGTKAELNHPLNPVNDNTIQQIVTNYTYNYLTIGIAPKFYIGSSNKFSFSVGGYYSIIKGTNGLVHYSDPRSGLTSNEFKGRQWNGFSPDGGISSSTFIHGLQSFERNDFGITLGFSYSFLMAKQNLLMIQLIDSYGMNDVYNKQYPENLPERNHSINLILGYLYNRSTKNKSN